MSIIVNADDLGYSLSVNKAIEIAINKGVISSTTVMANMSDEALQDAVRIMNNHPEVSYGVHLNLTEGSPLLRSLYLEKIGFYKKCGDVVLFNGKNYKKNFLNKKARKDLFMELDAQVSRIQKAGFTISHIDSHHHIHIKWFILPIVVKVAKKYKLNRIRIIRNIGSTGIDLFFRRIWKFYLRLLYPSVVTTRFFGAYSSFLKLHSNSCSKNDLIELMCHPGGKEKYNDEEKLLYSDSVFNYNIKINYNDI
jgi:predicted glycoside hydrolase/deacetylase ChbG (UPF0249 family)